MPLPSDIFNPVETSEDPEPERSEHPENEGSEHPEPQRSENPAPPQPEDPKPLQTEDPELPQSEDITSPPTKDHTPPQPEEPVSQLYAGIRLFTDIYKYVEANDVQNPRKRKRAEETEPQNDQTNTAATTLDNGEDELPRAEGVDAAKPIDLTHEETVSLGKKKVTTQRKASTRGRNGQTGRRGTRQRNLRDREVAISNREAVILAREQSLRAQEHSIVSGERNRNVPADPPQTQISQLQAQVAVLNRMLSDERNQGHQLVFRTNLADREVERLRNQIAWMQSVMDQVDDERRVAAQELFRIAEQERFRMSGAVERPSQNAAHISPEEQRRIAEQERFRMSGAAEGPGPSQQQPAQIAAQVPPRRLGREAEIRMGLVYPDPGRHLHSDQTGASRKPRSEQGKKRDATDGEEKENDEATKGNAGPNREDGDGNAGSALAAARESMEPNRNQPPPFNAPERDGGRPPKDANTVPLPAATADAEARKQRAEREEGEGEDSSVRMVESEEKAKMDETGEDGKKEGNEDAAGDDKSKA